MADNETGRLYGIGLGPGDPGLLTVKATELLGSLKAIFVPQSAALKKSLALKIAADYITEDCTVTELLFPMTKSRRELDKHWRDAAKPVAACLVAGSDCGFLTIGDPMLFSTFIYLRRAVSQLAPGVKVTIIPGVSAAFAAAAGAGVPLAEAGDSVAFITGDRADELEALTGEFQTIVIMKVAKRWGLIASLLKELGLDDRSYIAHRLGSDNETVELVCDAGDDPELGYMSTVIVRVGNV